MRALLVGNPNSGKTTLFNALTGLSARVGNYPGITVEHRAGVLDVAGVKGGLQIVDLPGTYSLAPRSDDEVVAVRGVFADLPNTPAPDIIVCVVDATALERNLYLTAQLRELPLPVVVALTMTDTIEKDGLVLDVDALRARLGVPVVKAPGVSGGARALKDLLGEIVNGKHKLSRTAMNLPRLPKGADLKDDERAIGKELARHFKLGGAHDALAQLAVCAASNDKLPVPAALLARVRALDAQRASIFVSARYGRVHEWAVDVVAEPKRADAEPHVKPKPRVPPSVRFTRAVDRVVLNKVAGPVILVGVFLALFMALFSWATPIMDLVASGMSALGAFAAARIPDTLPLLRSLVVNGVIAGVGNVVAFVPQIAILFLFLSVLEDTGYLARAAFLLDRLMAKTGLHGRAFVPLLSGFACAVPAIMAARTIENDKDRIVTILVTPLVSCSARLPVYALMIATVFSTVPPLFGVVPAGAAVMIAMYTLSIGAALTMAAVFKRTIVKSPTPPLVLELPPYRVPKIGQVVRAVLSRVRVFLIEAGTTILAITVVLWAMFTFPRDETLVATAQAARDAVIATTVEGEQRAAQLVAVDARLGEEQVRGSVAGMIGRAIEPVLAPLGFDWKLDVGIIASFAAREVLVSTLGLVYGLGDGADENNPSLREALANDRRADGKPVYTPLTALSLMVFFVLAMQCMSTLAAVKRETGGWKWPAFQFAYMSVLAYVAALIVFQGGRLLGFA